MSEVQDCLLELQEKERLLSSLRKVTSILSSPELSLSAKLQQSMDLILGGIRARKGSIMLVDEEDGTLTVMAATRQDLVGRKQKKEESSVSAHVCKTKKPLLVQDISKDPRFRSRTTYSTASLISVPLFSMQENRLIGVINASDHVKDSSFSDADLETVISYASWISPLVENSRLLSRIRAEKERYRIIADELSLKQKEILIAATERSELVEMVVHDFKSPLTAIISNLDLLRYMDLKDEQEPVVETALDGAQRLLTMINDFLEIARLDHFQNGNGELERINFLPIIQDLVQELEPVARKKNQILELAGDDDIYVLGEYSLLHHLMQNLLSNAIKYTPESGSIRIGWQKKESSRREDPASKLMTFFIEDTGIGVPDDLKKTIFQKFRRGRRQEKHEREGSGIGLFICHRIATILKGEIWVEDVHPQGSRFCFTLFAHNGTSPDAERGTT
ncbi:MAG: ATP-binding protein [Desulfovibrionales bacterium]